MGSGPLVRKKSQENKTVYPWVKLTSGKPGSKPSGPDPSRVVSGLPLRTPDPQPSPKLSVEAKKMDAKGDVFTPVSNIFVVMGASAS